ncbi:MAG: TPM domain-containing protein [Burkholderiales bacterium]
MTLTRALKHLLTPGWVVRRAFPQEGLDRITAAVSASEKRHRGEVRFAVEGALDFLAVVRGMTPRQRALEVFSLLRVWDTEENTGVLLYLQLVDHDIEIVADRGIARLIPQAEWEAICRRMEEAFRGGRYESGVIQGIAEVSDLLVRHFPADVTNVDELADKPALL